MKSAVLLSYWIVEREEMRLRRTRGTEPTRLYGWSDDPNMGLVRYCNVRREDDKVTQWLATNWRTANTEVWEMVLARMVNYIPTLQEVISASVWDGGLPAIAHTMKERRRREEKVFTSAYTISTCGQSMDKIDYVMGIVKETQEEGELTAPTLAEAHRQLMSVKGLGSFLAAQVVADFKNTAGHTLASAPDWHTWSAPGPGSLKGLSTYYETTVTSKGYDIAIEECWKEVKPLLPLWLQDLHMQDFQNCLCEFSKYMRVRSGGHARNKYSAR